MLINAPGLDELGRGYNILFLGAAAFSNNIGAAFKAPLVAYEFNDGLRYDSTAANGGDWTHAYSVTINKDDPTPQVNQLINRVPKGVRAEETVSITQPGTMSLQTTSRASELAEKIGVSASVEASYGPYSGSLEGSYNISRTENFSSIFSLLDVDCPYYNLRIDHGHEPALDSIFSTDMAALPLTFDPSVSDQVAQFRNFFATYGTHFISEVTMGLKLRIVSKTQTASGLTTTDISAALTAGYSAIASAEVKASVTYGSKSQTFLGNSHKTVEIYGGTPHEKTAVQFDLAADIVDPDHMSNWLNSAVVNPQVIALQVRGIADLALTGANGDPRRAEAIREAFEYFAIPNATVPLKEFLLDTDHGKDFFYATFRQAEAVSPSGGNPVGRVLPNNTAFSDHPSATPLFRRLLRNTPFHFYTTERTEAADSDEGIECYVIKPTDIVFKAQGPFQTLPVTRWGSNVQHAYTKGEQPTRDGVEFAWTLEGNNYFRIFDNRNPSDPFSQPAG
jgi:hypothetical protein